MKNIISVLIPVYNVEKYLKQCIDSVLNQKVENIEIILVDDGSTDSSGKICDEYAKRDEKIKVIHKVNGGLLSARRTAVEEASGEYFAFLDSDDYWEEGLLEKVFRTIEKYGCDMVIFNYKSVYPDRQEKNEPVFQGESVFENEKKELLYKTAIEGAKLNNLVLKIVKKDIVDIDEDYSEFYDVSNAEDALQSAPLLINAKKVVYLDECFYCYRKQSGMTSRIKATDKFCVTKAREKITQIYEETEFDLSDSIEKGFFNYLSDFGRSILYGYMDNPKKLRKSLDYVFSSDFYKRARESAYKKQSFINKSIIWLAEKNLFMVIEVLSLLLKFKNLIKR